MLSNFLCLVPQQPKFLSDSTAAIGDVQSKSTSQKEKNDEKKTDAVELPVSGLVVAIFPVSDSAAAVGEAQSGSSSQMEKDDGTKTHAEDLPVSHSAAAKSTVQVESYSQAECEEVAS